MKNELINISWMHVAVTTLFVISAGVCSLCLRLKLEKDLLIGTVRTFIQLFLLGYVLKYVFALNNPLVIFFLFSLMIYFAASIISGRVKEKKVPYFLPVLASMFSFLLMDLGLFFPTLNIYNSHISGISNYISLQINFPK